MISTLDIFNPQVTKSGSTITVTYCHHNYSGTCTYQEVHMKGKFKPINQTVHILTNTDMGDVIEYLYKNGDIVGEESLPQVSMAIQNHSRMVLDLHPL